MSYSVEYAIEKAVFAPIYHATDKMSAIRMMVQAILSPRGHGRDEVERVALAIFGREDLGSTGIGQGFAVPHSRSPLVTEPCCGWFVAYPPIDFEALDGVPVHVLYCGVFPPNSTGDHLRILEFISHKLLKNSPFDPRLSLGQNLTLLDTLRNSWQDLGRQDERFAVDPIGQAIGEAEERMWGRIRAEVGGDWESKTRLRSEILRADLEVTRRLDRTIREAAGSDLSLLEVRTCEGRAWVRATAPSADRQARLREVIEGAVPREALAGVAIKSS